MGRGEPNARGRLTEAALELYRERGFDQTTVAEIAGRAGLTERTFFRYFADKREVLFWGAEDLRARIVEVLTHAPKSTAPLDAVVAAFGAGGTLIAERTGQARARQRQAVITAHLQLQ